MAQFTFPNKVPNNNPSSYHFDSMGQRLTMLVSNEIQRAVQAGILITSAQIRKAINSTKNNDSKFNFSNTDDSSYMNTTKMKSGRIVNLKFMSTNYVNDFGQIISTPELELDICLIDASATNNIVQSTPINETGSIKELINQSEWSLNVTGVLIGFFRYPNQDNPLAGKPLEAQGKLIAIKQAPVPINVESEYLRQFGITQIVVNTLTMPQTEDINLQRFTLSATSNNPDITIL